MRSFLEVRILNIEKQSVGLTISEIGGWTPLHSTSEPITPTLLRGMTFTFLIIFLELRIWSCPRFRRSSLKLWSIVSVAS